MRDVARSAQFYGRWFGFPRHVVRDDGVQFVERRRVRPRTRPDRDPDSLPASFHLDLRLDSPGDVRTLYERMEADGLPIREALSEEKGFIYFRCLDPDGHLLEVYWQ